MAIGWLRWAPVLGGFALAFWSLFLVSQDVKARRVLGLAVPIQNGAALKPEEAERIATLPQAGELACRRDVQEAAMLASLAVLETRMSDTSPQEKISEAYERVRDATRHFLGCFPFDSHGWLRSAIATMRLEGPVELVARHVEMSQLTAPREAWILSTRAPFLIALRQTNDPRIVEALDRDLDTLFRSGSLGQLRRIYESVGDYGKDVIRQRLTQANVDVLAATDPERLELLYAIVGLKVSRDDCVRYFDRLKACVGER